MRPVRILRLRQGEFSLWDQQHHFDNPEKSSVGATLSFLNKLQGSCGFESFCPFPTPAG